MSQPPFRDPRYVEPRIDVEHRDDGSIILRNPHPLRDPAPNLISPIRQWAQDAPERVWLGKRKPSTEGFGEWDLLTYADAEKKVFAIGQALIDRGFDQSTPVMILSGNSIEHALMSYGAILAGAPATPVSPSYSTISTDFEKLKYVFDLVEPKMIFMQESAPFERALAALPLDGVELVTVDGSMGTPFAELLATRPGAEAEARFETQHDDEVAKYLFTSGSTGMPKAVITTQRMMRVNAVMPRSVQREHEDDEPGVLLNWLPWNHCFGGNAILNNTLTSGGTLYIDGGRPVPGQFEETVANLREVAPTAYSNVPAAYPLLVDALESDDALAKNFFSRLRSLAYGGAALSQDIYNRMQDVALRTTGERIVFSSGYGATETAPTIMNVHWPTERMGLLGLPLPGIELKLAPTGQKMEVRVRGDCITPGYHKNPEKTAEAYDEEGFYRLGDGARFVNPDNPMEGLVFDGRVAEDFKLSTGTWVSAGKLRVQAVGASNGILQDALIAGLDRDYIGILGFPNIPACRNVAGDPEMAVEDLVRHPAVLEQLAEGLREHNAGHPGSSTRVSRALLMVEPPSIDAGELTDKGYINQATALSRRADLVEKLYAEPPGNDVLVVGK
ncbi:AMP-binding protein [Parvibaculum sp.]|jgi:feruloyl-CoA synthase|uniref:AMP-binding protein n=1 Tax=Parvibaculum sp. TaxID=2024848 RepID=UPI000C94F048|nr:AMP-binding protein [Parvibaculum sp.]MAB13447.1 acyl-CoA synthetase [Parvibaculum sp.]